MAAKSRRREVILSASVLQTLRDVWRWNADHYGPPHADGYLQFLHSAIDTLALSETAGRPIAARPDLRYLLVRRRSGGHGHVAVFQLTDGRVTVLRLFHTAQDWQAALDE